MLLRATTSIRTSVRCPSSHRFHLLLQTFTCQMSNSAYILPFDPSNPTTSSLKNVDIEKLWSSTPGSKLSEAPKEGTTRIFYGSGPDGSATVLTSLGGGWSKKQGAARRETFRKAVGSAVKAIKAVDGVEEIKIDATIDPHAAAVASHLALYKFDLQTKGQGSVFDPRKPLQPWSKLKVNPLEQSKDWERGVVYANSQNLARTLMEMPANWMTPTKFSERVLAEFKDLDNVEIFVRDEEWAAEKGMNTFLSVTHGTSEPAKFLEIHYKGASDKSAPPVGLVGKGITFDTGGISLKPSADMKLMRGDMGGAASVVGVALAVAKLKLPINLVVATPLTENMPGPAATKPGDVIYAINGKSVEVDNTDAEGRLVLADAIHYLDKTYGPKVLIDVATLTGAMDIALGEIYTGVFTESDELWSALNTAGSVEHDRFWRMPLDEDYGPQIYSSNADLCNTGGKPAGSCTAALFLSHFPVDKSKWAHIDIAGTMEATRPTPYLEKGMTGRSVTALIEYLRTLS
ncbi:leucine aminopeptidase, partial [Flagelloscypha sp. PMI_526]